MKMEKTMLLLALLYILVVLGLGFSMGYTFRNEEIALKDKQIDSLRQIVPVRVFFQK